MRQTDCLCHDNIVSVDRFSMESVDTMFSPSLLVVWTEKQRFLHPSVWSNARNAVSDIFRFGKIQSSCHNSCFPFFLNFMTRFSTSRTMKLTDCWLFAFDMPTNTYYFSSHLGFCYLQSTDSHRFFVTLRHIRIKKRLQYIQKASSTLCSLIILNVGNSRCLSMA